MGRSIFSHFLVLSYSSPPFTHSLSTLSPCNVATTSLKQSAPASLGSKELRCNCTGLWASQSSALDGYTSSSNLKKMKASGFQPMGSTRHGDYLDAMKNWIVLQVFQREMAMESLITKQSEMNEFRIEDLEDGGRESRWVSAFLFGHALSVVSPEVAYASDTLKINEMFEIGELLDLGIQLLYLLLLLGLLGVGTYFVIRQVLFRRELDLSAEELQESPTI